MKKPRAAASVEAAPGKIRWKNFRLLLTRYDCTGQYGRGNEEVNVDGALSGHVLVCAGAGCISSGCFEVEKALKASLAKHNLTEEFRVVETGCIGTCDLGPLLVVYPGGVFYQKVEPQDVEEIVTEHLIGGQVVKKAAV